jgi:hypothetical protein
VGDIVQGHHQAPVHPGRLCGLCAADAAGGDLVQPRDQGAGRPRWQTLHKAGLRDCGAGLLHFFWMRSGKNDFAEVAIYAAILAVLLGGGWLIS